MTAISPAKQQKALEAVAEWMGHKGYGTQKRVTNA